MQPLSGFERFEKASRTRQVASFGKRKTEILRVERKLAERDAERGRKQRVSFSEPITLKYRYYSKRKINSSQGVSVLNILYICSGKGFISWADINIIEAFSLFRIKEIWTISYLSGVN